ncbi:MAG: hypothetical protein FWD19_04225, partial [Defluviitaleaceae bacterium]|nr:hypothetical protein [Defluviitaleaceae bacterium]
MKNKMKRFAAIFLSVIIFSGGFGALPASEVFADDERLRAFPGAEGYGRYATGGAGGEIYVVTNLNSSGAGSFFDAVSGTGTTPRTVIFAVSGVINAAGNNNFTIGRSNLTIAGQTAPGDGVFVHGNGRWIRLNGNNVIMRFMRFGSGTRDGTSEGHRGDDALDVVNSRNLIIDHCSFVWGGDETLNFQNTQDVTVQWTLIGEGLSPYSRSSLVNDNSRLTMHHNLFANTLTRNPRVTGSIDFVNNVVYNWRGTGFDAGANTDNPNGTRHSMNIVGNMFLRGPMTRDNEPGINVGEQNPRLYIGDSAGSQPNMLGFSRHNRNPIISFSPITAAMLRTQRNFVHMPTRFAYSPTQLVSAEHALRNVIAYSGAWPRLPVIEQRIMANLRDGNGFVPLFVGDVVGSSSTRLRDVVNMTPQFSPPASDRNYWSHVYGIRREWADANGFSAGMSHNAMTNFFNPATGKIERRTFLEAYINDMALAKFPNRVWHHDGATNLPPVPPMITYPTAQINFAPLRVRYAGDALIKIDAGHPGNQPNNAQIYSGWQGLTSTTLHGQTHTVNNRTPFGTFGFLRTFQGSGDGRSRSESNHALYRDFLIVPNGSTLRVDIPNGKYIVAMMVGCQLDNNILSYRFSGDSGRTWTNRFSIARREGFLPLLPHPLENEIGRAQWVVTYGYHHGVAVSDGRLDIMFDGGERFVGVMIFEENAQIDFPLIVEGAQNANSLNWQTRIHDAQIRILYADYENGALTSEFQILRTLTPGSGARDGVWNTSHATNTPEKFAYMVEFIRGGEVIMRSEIVNSRDERVFVPVTRIEN